MSWAGVKSTRQWIDEQDWPENVKRDAHELQTLIEASWHANPLTLAQWRKWAARAIEGGES